MSAHLGTSEGIEPSMKFCAAQKVLTGESDTDGGAVETN